MLAESLYALPPWPPSPSAHCCPRNCDLASVFSGKRAYSLGEHARGVTSGDGQHLLLPLRGVQSASRLREDVRIAEVRFAELGEDLRQAAVEAACREQRCRTTV